MGPAVVVAESDPNPRRIALPKSAVVQECRRLENAFGSALRQLGSLTKQGALRTGDPGKAIFEAHGEILSDPLLLSETIEVIRTQRVNAEWAVMTVAERFASVLKKSKDAHLRERAGDINDVGARVRRVLDDGGRIRIPRGAIVFTEEVTPSLMVELARQGVGAICAEIGGWTSHSFIIAREAGVPAVTGIKGIHRNLSDGDPVIVDGFRGEVILRPGPESLRHFQDADLASAPSLVGAGQRKRSNTLDGVHVRVRANIDPVKGLDELGPSDAEGVGLFRSESLYQDGKGFPSESSQASAYRKIVKAAGRPGAVIRTFDLSYDRVLQSSGELERNPSLGLRGTRLMLELQKEFRAQIRALLRASAEGRLDILLPMVSDLSEVRAVRELIREESARLRSKGVKTGRPRLGAMIEVPAAVLMAKEFLAEVDFVNIGTNDLVQYTLGADRDNGAVSGYFRTLHPAVLRAVSQVVKEGRRIGKQVILCGEMAGSPAYVGVLIGLGVTDISVGFNSMPKVRRVIRGLAFEECRDVVGRMLDVSTASESEKIWENEFGKRLGALVPNLSFQGSRPQNTP